MRVAHLGICLFSALAMGVQAHVCDKVRAIDGVYTDILFDQAVINGVSLDYYSLRSRCDFYCLFSHLNHQQIQYRLHANNISVFDSSSVGTVTIERTHRGVLDGYLTCSSGAMRHYISLPFTLVRSRVLSDMQSNDRGMVSRIITIGGYSQQDYQRLQADLKRQAKSEQSQIGFMVYQISHRGRTMTVQLGSMRGRGDFIVIVETKQ